MQYVSEFFNDQYAFWNTNTKRWVIILFILFTLDVITTMLILDRGGTEYNQFMIPFVKIPLLFGLIKMIALGVIITSTKIMYTLLQDTFYSDNNDIVCIYLTFAVVAGITLFVVIQNVVALL